MIKNKFSLDDIGIQIEEHEEDLYVAFYLDADYGIKLICRVLLKELSKDYLNKYPNKDSYIKKDLEPFLKGWKVLPNKESTTGYYNNKDKKREELFPDSGFGDSFGELVF